MNDEQAMQLAIDLAALGQYTCSPNPRVGCVLLKNGELIGQGYHRKAGEGHAEVNAIADAAGKNHDIRGATAYVTLEPCNHTGKTPPCSQALIAAEVSRVVVAMVDPNPLVAGSGVQTLRDAGIAVDEGLLEEKARALNPGFIKRMETGLPWVRIKMAMSLDGRTAMASGESQWITGPEARSDVQRLRASSCVVVSGIDTVLQDDAALTVRADELGLDNDLAQAASAQQPLRVVLDSKLRVPADCRLLQQPGPVWVVAATDKPNGREALEKAGAEVLIMPNGDGRIDLQALLKKLADYPCNEVMVEAGATLAGSFVEADLVDQLTVYMAPTLLGSEARPLLQLPIDRMIEQRSLKIKAITPVGDDWRIDACPVVGAKV